MATDSFDQSWQDHLAQEVLRAFEMFPEAALKADRLELLARHARELCMWNQTFNITAITAPQEMAVKHYVDSLVLVVEISAGLKVADLGSGGGFPGIPLKVCRPDLDMTLVDSVRKKVAFMSHAIRVLCLEGIVALQSRVEQMTQTERYVCCFDRVVSRAFTGLGRFVGLAEPLLVPGGKLIALKGRLSRQELNQVDADLFRVDVKPYTLPGGHHRCLVTVSRR